MITHKGTIISISAGGVSVNISPDSANCGGCSISSLCSKSEVIFVKYPRPTSDLIGRKVIVGTSVRTRRRGIVLFFIIPIILLIASLWICLAANLSDAFSSVVALSMPVVWYLVLWLLRVRIRSEAEFSIVKLL